MSYMLSKYFSLDDMHCAQAYVAEMTGTQNAKEYRRG